MIKETSKSISGTSFFGTTIITSVNKLIQLFPNSYSRDMEKTNYFFELENSNGDVFTIYDWKRPLPELNEEIEFNIGGYSSEITEKSKLELLNEIKTTR